MMSVEVIRTSEEIVVGTNEEFILGFNIIDLEDGTVRLQASFANHAHNGIVKQVAVSEKYLVSGSTDEFIKIFNLSTRREEGLIPNHNATITCLQFHESGYLFSGSEDGKIGIYKQGKWELERELRGHTTGITGIAIHPTGKLALSISKNKRLFTWDLMKGKKAFVGNLRKGGETILWSPTGTHYLISSRNMLDIFSVENGSVVHSVDFKQNIYAVMFLTDDLILIGGESKNVCLYNLKTEEEILQWNAHENRVKAFTSLSCLEEDCKRFASCSSDGFIKIWCINISSLSTPRLLGEVNTKCRIICMTLYSCPEIASDPEIEKLEEQLFQSSQIIYDERREYLRLRKQKMLEDHPSLNNNVQGDNLKKKRKRKRKVNEKLVSNKKSNSTVVLLKEKPKKPSQTQAISKERTKKPKTKINLKERTNNPKTKKIVLNESQMKTQTKQKFKKKLSGNKKTKINVD